MKTLIIILVLSSLTSVAEEGGGKPKLLVIDKEINTKDVEKIYTVESEERPAFNFPTVGEREDLFSEIKFPESYDELKKDILYMELKSSTLSELVEKYPELKELDLKRLKGKLNE